MSLTLNMLRYDKNPLVGFTKPSVFIISDNPDVVDEFGIAKLKDGSYEKAIADGLAALDEGTVSADLLSTIVELYDEAVAVRSVFPTMEITYDTDNTRYIISVVTAGLSAHAIEATPAHASWVGSICKVKSGKFINIAKIAKGAK